MEITAILILIVVNVILSAIVGMASESKGLGFASGFFISFFFSALIGFLFVIASEKRIANEAQSPVAGKASNVPAWQQPFELPPEKKCPKCAETIKFEAIVCRYCGNEFNNVASESDRLRQDYDALVRQAGGEERQRTEAQREKSEERDRVNAIKDRRENIVIVWGAIVFLAALIVYFYFKVLAHA